MIVARHYLLVFDRSAGRLLEQKEYADNAVALAARFELERRYADDPNVEIVVMTADSLDALRATHARYFTNAGDLYRQSLKRVKRMKPRPSSLRAS